MLTGGENGRVEWRVEILEGILHPWLCIVTWRIVCIWSRCASLSGFSVYQLQKRRSTWRKSSPNLSFSSQWKAGELWFPVNCEIFFCRVVVWWYVWLKFCSCFLILFVMWIKLNVTKFQVFDLGEETPDTTLRRIYLNLEKLKAEGNKYAINIQERLRIIVSWVNDHNWWWYRVWFLYTYIMVLLVLVHHKLKDYFTYEI